VCYLGSNELKSAKCAKMYPNLVNKVKCANSCTFNYLRTVETLGHCAFLTTLAHLLAHLTQISAFEHVLEHLGTHQQIWVLGHLSLPVSVLLSVQLKNFRTLCICEHITSTISTFDSTEHIRACFSTFRHLPAHLGTQAP